MVKETTPLLDLYQPNNGNNQKYSGGRIQDDIENPDRDTDSNITANKDSDISHTVSEAATLSWLRLFLFVGACVVSGGIIPGQNVYNGLLCEAGLFSYACRQENHLDDDVNLAGVEHVSDTCCSAQWLLVANIMNTLSVTIAFFFFIGGLVFDSIGGQWAGVIGCVINAMGFFLLAALLFASREIDSPLMETIVFCVAVILIDAGSIISNVSFFGFLWHLPRHQALILSISSCCTNVSALVPLVLKFILRQYGSIFSLSSLLSVYAMTILAISTPISWIVVPSIDEYRNRAMEVLGMPIPRSTIRNVREAINTVKAGTRILRQHSRLHYFTLVAVVFAYVSPLVYMTMTDPLGQEIFGNKVNSNSTLGNNPIAFGAKESGERLAVLYNQSSALLGLFVGPILGVAVDHYKRAADGVVHLSVTILILFGIIGAFCPIPNWTIQTMVVTAACFGQIAVSLFMMQYAVIFASPNRIGTVVGIFTAVLGALALPLFLLMSADIAFSGCYIKPTVVVNIIGFIVWLLYIMFLKNTDPWPSSPVFLPEDEQEVAKMFAVGTFEDAAFVAGISLQEFRRLAASSKVVDQRTLLNAALTVEAGERIMIVARRYSSKEVAVRQSISNPFSSFSSKKEDNESVARLYPIPLHLVNGNVRGEEFVIRRGTASSALETVEISFNGHGGFDGKKEPTFDWMLELIGPPDDPRRIAVVHSFFAPVFSCAEVHGMILEVRVGDITVASCACFHPGGLENGSVFQIGSNKYYYSLATSGATPTMNREIMGTQTLQRIISLKQDSRVDEYRRNYGPMFYVALLGVHPSYQGRGYGKKLLNIVAHWADCEGMDCYLECSEANVLIYNRCGYENIWRINANTDDNKILSTFGMARKYQAK